MKSALFFLSICCWVTLSTAQQKKTLNITKTTVAPKIDGVLDDAIWTTVEVATDFVQYDPEMGVKAAENKKTEVRVTYNDQAIFVAAYLHDDPEDIFKVFSPRDDFGQADYFGVTFNPNNDAQNDIKFYVMSSGTQADIVGGSSGRRGGGPGPRGDRGWNAVWDSAVKHVDDGWIVEMKIPYAALRFSNQEDPVWGIQFYRKYRKGGLDYSWSPIDRTVGQQGIYDGELHGLKNISPPTRLSFYPFASYTAINQSGETVSNTGFGMDVKYGITESFTLDLTLIPDFSQAAFDKVELNLGPFEQRFDEQRQFFKEGVNLFSKGDLFYSRRIGNAPVGRYDIYDDLVDEIDEVEEVIDNPKSVKMLNAIKISGRNKHGLGIGVFNAITEKTTARIKNTKYDLDINDVKIDSTITYRDQTTEPFTNYNIIVLDQRFNQNSSVSFVNTNVTRTGGFRDANASALLLSLTDKTNTYRVSGQGKMSRITDIEDNSTGFDAGFEIGKVSGTYQYGIEGSIRDDKYDVNDLGFGVRNNFKSLEGKFRYEIFEPFGIFNSFNIRTESQFNWRHSNNDFTGNRTSINVSTRTKNLMWVGGNITMMLGEQRDYFEPRDQENDRFFSYSNWIQGRTYLYTNSNKALSTNANFSYGKLFQDGLDIREYGIRVGPEYRFSDKLTIKYQIDYQRKINDRGYVDNINDGEIIFGQRDVKTVENTISGTLNFNSLNSLTLSFRNYWSTATYEENLYTLLEGGELTTSTGRTITNLDLDPNRNFNIWNLDLSYEWQFAPGSQLIALYRNQLFNSSSASRDSFRDSLKDLFDQDIQHTFSLKMVYFLDYNSLKGIFKKKDSTVSAP
ncbi:carbohydrate binding family 9 domain-containing protein [Flavobacteriaceae bacterium S0862]|nr:carbohydrate binding family 9 domain-containing protein [Flavobacteriaceae bacterium S0862]